MAKVEPNSKDKPRKFQHIYKDADGGESIWKYDLDKFPNGPISVEMKYPLGYEKNLKKAQKEAKLEKSLSVLEKAKQVKKEGKKLDNKNYW
jgi:hypothetical protein